MIFSNTSTKLLRMKNLILIFLGFLSFSLHAQVIKDQTRDDGTHEYWFTLDEFSTPVQFPIRVEQVDGTTVKLSGETGLNGKKGFIIIENLISQRVDTIRLNPDGIFNYTCNKKIHLTVEIDGYVTYEKENQGLEGLSMLVVKLHPNPEDIIYLLVTKTVISETALDKYMRCLYSTKKTGSDTSTCTLPEYIRLETR